MRELGKDLVASDKYFLKCERTPELVFEPQLRRLNAEVCGRRCKGQQWEQLLSPTYYGKDAWAPCGHCKREQAGDLLKESQQERLRDIPSGAVTAGGGSVPMSEDYTTHRSSLSTFKEHQTHSK